MKQVVPYRFQKRQPCLLIALFICLSHVSFGQSTTENHVTTKVYKVPSTSPIGSPGAAQAIEQVTYFDGLGRPVQQIGKGVSGTGKDLVTHIEYDAWGRQVKDYLPYERGGSASLNFENNALGGTEAFYDQAYFQNTQNPYSEKKLEDSPLNRVFLQAAPGNDWAMGGGHEISFDYQANSGGSNSKVYHFKVGEALTAPVLQLNSANNGNYPANHLYKTITRDENWGEEGLGGEVIEYRNKLGQLVLRRIRNRSGQETADTHYVYDDHGNLTFVVPPLLSGQVVAGSNLVANHQYLLDELGYQYKYDHRNRLIQKKLPGKQKEFMVYDALDRLVAIGPVNPPFTEVTGQGWLFTKYDAFDRVAYTLWMEAVVNQNTQSTLQGIINGQGVISETAIPGSNTVNGVGFQYTRDVYPTSGFHVLTVNYYDDYRFYDVDNPGAVLGQEVYYNNDQKPVGLPTGSWVRALETVNDVNGTTAYVLYDQKERPVRTHSLNYLGGHTQTDVLYDFMGKTLETQTLHQKDNQTSPVTIEEAFTYTDQDRLLEHTHTVNGGGTEVLSANEYDALGQLVTKQVGRSIDDPLQKVDHKYNVRGWLTDINNIHDLNDQLDAGAPQDLFAFRIHYNNVTNTVNGQVKALYNGNIAGTQWRTASDNIRRKYGYTYDHQNRLTDAWYSIPGAAVNGSYNEHLSYDSNGNILSLQRYGEVEDASLVMMIDDLDYGYDDGNKLLNVTDYEAHPAGFDDGNDHSGMGGQDDFEYDDYGNLVMDRNKGITKILYNHLNLPKKIVFEELGEIDYLYDANGVKLKKTVNDFNTSSETHTHYVDGFQYTDDHLDFFPHAEGYVNVLEYSEFNYVYTYTDHLGNIRLRYALDPDAGGLAILEEDHYYPFGLKHRGYNGEHEVFEKDTQIGVVLVPVNPFLEDKFKYKFGGKELQSEFNLEMYDFGARNYDPAIGRWMNVDPLAELAYDKTPYHFVSNNPINRIDPDGLTDYTINKKTGDVTQIGEANDEPDRVLKTNRKGEVKTNRKGEAKVAIGDIEQGILQDGMNLKDESNIIEVGGEGQPSEQGVEAFALRLSDYVGKEIGGAYFSIDGAENTTHITLGAYKNNRFKETKSHGHNLRSFFNTKEEISRFSIRGFFHTHPSGVGISDSDRLVPSRPDRKARDNAHAINPTLKFFLLTHPEYGGKFPMKIPYTTGYPVSDR